MSTMCVTATRRSLPALFDFLSLPPQTRDLFPLVYRSHQPHRDSAIDDALRLKLSAVYGGLSQSVSQIPAEGLLLRNV